MKNSARRWARRGTAFLLSISMALGGVPVSVYAEAIEPAQPIESSVVEDTQPTITNEVVEQTVQAQAEEEPQVAMPAFSDEAQVGDVTVRVQADEGTFPEGVSLLATTVTENEAQAALDMVSDQVADDVNDSAVIDVRVVDGDGNEVEPANGKEAKVSFQSARVAQDGVTAEVFHLDESEGAVQPEKLDAVVNGDTVSAATDSFSTFVVTFVREGATTEIKRTVTTGSYITASDLANEVFTSYYTSGTSAKFEEYLDANDILSISSDGAWLEPTKAGTATINLTAYFSGSLDETVRISVTVVEETELELQQDTLEIQDKVYDGTTTATVTGAPKFVDTVNGNEVTVNYSMSAAFNYADAGSADADYAVPATVTVQLTGESATQYKLNVNTIPLDGKITPRPVTISGVKAADREYDGTTAATLDFSSAQVEGLIDQDKDKVQVVAAGEATGAFEDKNVGEGKTVTVETTAAQLTGDKAANYTIEEVANTTATITQKEVTVSGLKGNDKIYDGTTTAEIDVTDAAISEKVGEDVVSVASATGSFADADAGTGKEVTVQPEDVVLDGTDAGNYKVKTVGSVTPATISRRSIIIKPVNASKVYGEDDPELEAELFMINDEGEEEPFEDPDHEIITYELERAAGEDANKKSADDTEGVEGYAITCKNLQETQGNYTVTCVDGTFDIYSKEVTVTPDDDEKTYGEDDPEELTATVEGLKEGEEIAYEVTRDEGEDAGTYDITATGDEYQNGANSLNYHVVYCNPAVFTINSLEITLTVNDASKTYGEADPEFTVDESYKEDLAEGDEITYELDRIKGEDGGQTYTIFVKDKKEYQSGREGSDAPNYHITYVDGKLTINRRKATVTANNLNKFWGDPDPALTANVTGTIKGETVTYSLSRTPGTTVGTYTITPSGDKIQGSYEVEYKTGTLTIERPQTLDATYQAHVRTFGWLEPVQAGAVAGTTGKAKRLEAITLKVPRNTGIQGGIEYRSHVQSYGWMGWQRDGMVSGTSGLRKRLEATQIKLYGDMANYYDVYYRLHVQSLGWMGWAKNGQMAGTTAEARRAEAIQVVIVPKGSPAPSASYKGVTTNYKAAFRGLQ